MAENWVTVFAGPIWEVHFLEARLQEAGHTTFVPSNNLKVLDPFATGANSLDADLQVPGSRFDEARAVVETAQAEKRAQADRDENFGTEDSVWSSREMREAHKTGQRVRWAMWCVITAPFGVYYGFKYLALLDRVKGHPPQHVFTLFSFVICVVITGLYTVMVAMALASCATL